MKKLTSKELKFVNLCIELGNNSEAYRRAYNDPEAHPDLAGTKSYQLLQKVHIKEALAELKHKEAEQHALTRAKLIQMYLEIINDSDLTMDAAKLENATKEEKSRFFRMAQVTSNGDKLRALDSLKKMLGYDAPEKVEQEIQVNINIKRNRD